MSLSKARIDGFSLYTIENGRFKLDGGAMFGVVPKILWSKKIGSDDQNRIVMAARSLLIVSEHTSRIYIIDTGMGTKFDEKFASIYGVDFSQSNMEGSLEAQGFKKSDITDIIFTHLHFDHCGGISSLNDEGEAVNDFPEANIWVTRQQWETANHPNAREKASFFRENLDPIEQSGRLRLIGENHEFEPGLTSLVVNGHTRGQQLPLIRSGRTSLLFAADLIPTSAHLPLPWIMGYDMYPVDTLDEKNIILERCFRENIYLYMQHDAHHEIVSIKPQRTYFEMGRSMQLADISEQIV